MQDHDDYDRGYTSVHTITHGGGAGAAAHVTSEAAYITAGRLAATGALAVSGVMPTGTLPKVAEWPEVEAGPLPPAPRRYLRPSAYWADRWLDLRRP